MSDFSLFERAYALLENVTPRRYDCGRLCGSRCCQNLSAGVSPAESGMRLLPHEKEYLQSIGAENFTYCSSDDGDFLLCGGHCDRAFRPFACRIFPYYAHFDGSRVFLRADIRAAICPLVTTRACRRLTPRFLRNAKKAVRILAAEPLILEDMKKNAAFVDSLYELYEQLKPV